MNLGERVECGRLTPRTIGLSDRKVESILAAAIDASSYAVNGAPLAYNDLANLPSVDTAVTENSSSLVTSGAVSTAIANVTSETSSLYLPVSNPTATGTMTVPVLHATTIQLNGTDLANTLSGKQATLTSYTQVPGLSVALSGKQGTLTGTVDVPGLDTTLAGKQATLSSAADVPGLSAALAAKQDALTGIADVPGLTTSLAGKQSMLSGTSDVPGLDSALAGKQAALSSTADVPGLDTALAGKQATLSSTADVPGLTSALSAKQDALTGTADVPGLTTALNGKQATLSINNTFSSTFNGVTYLFGGLHLSPSGTLTYIPQPISGFYAPLSSPTFSGAVSLPANTSVGNVSSTELGYLDGVTSAIQVQLNGINNLMSGKQLALDTPTVASPSGDGNLTLTSSTGFNTLLTYTPPDRTLTGVNITPAACSATGDIVARGVAKMGYTTHGSAWATWAHNNKFNGTDYALLHSSLGWTILNAAAGMPMYFRQGNVTKAEMRTDGRFAFYDIAYLGTSGTNNFIWGGNFFGNFAQLTAGTYVSLNAPTTYYSGTIAQGSDDRLKFNEKELTDGIAIMQQLRPVSYTKVFNLGDDPSTGLPETGFIAQEVRSVRGLESLVTEDPQTHDQEGGATLMLSYNGILAHSVQAMQELIQKVEALEARLAAAGL